MRLSLYHNLGLEGGPNFRWQYNSDLHQWVLEMIFLNGHNR